MILRRFMKHVSDQNWFAVGLDVLVVITGIFLGMQVTEWNEQIKNDDRGRQFLVRIQGDLREDIRNLDYRGDFWGQVLENADTALLYAERGKLENDSAWETLLAFFQASQLAPYQPTRITYQELGSAGELNLIASDDIRARLSHYYTFTSGPQMDFVLRINPPYRDRIRGQFPSWITRHIWENCHLAGALDSQELLSCNSPVGEQEAMALLEKISSDDETINLLRTWASTLQVRRGIRENSINMANELLTIISLELSQQ